MAEDQYLDEKIISMIHSQAPEDGKSAAETPSAINQAEGVEILGKTYTFSKAEPYPNIFTMLLPTEFAKMDEAVAKFKYPAEARPEIILTDATGSVNITFNYLPEKVADAEMPEARDAMVEVLKRMQPAAKWFAIGEKTVNEKLIAFCEFNNPALDGKIYNIMYFAAIHENLLMGAINFKANELEWKPVAHQMIETIAEIPKEGK